MKKIKVADQGFYGCYWPVEGSTCAMIGMFVDDCEDYMAKSAVKWLQKTFHINVVTLSPGHKDYSHCNLPVERIGAAITYLKKQGNQKFGIVGASTTAMFALVAASYYPEITMTIALTPSDFVMEGFHQGKRDGMKEWPGDGESTLTWEGKPLPYLPYAYRHPEYYQKVMEQSKRTKNLIASSELFVESEKRHPIQEDEFIKVERIHGKLLLIGAEDDVLWDTAKYIRRMEKRLSQRAHVCQVESHVYAHGTHFVFPEGMVKTMLPVGSGLLFRAFAAGKQYPKECRATRMDIEQHVKENVYNWLNNG